MRRGLNLAGKIDRSAGPNGCWLWTAYRNARGYGVVGFNRKIHLAHRVCYSLKHGAIPPGLFVCHRCDNPPCVNPDHMFLGTQKDNMADCSSKGRINSKIGDRLWAKINPERVPRGENNQQAKLTTNKVLKIRELYMSGNISQRQLAKDFGVSKGTIYYVVKGLVWAHILPSAASVAKITSSPA